MRDILLLATLLGVTPFIWRAPIIGVVAWIWITLMNPQREVYGFLADAGLNFYIAALTIVAWAVSKERKVIPLDLAAVTLLIFSIWACITTYFALDPSYSSGLLDRTLKTAVLAIAILAIVNSKYRMQAVIWAIAISLGYYSVKGGGFVILTGGSHRVYGPEKTMIEDNNALGLALVMLLPLLNYLRLTSENRYARLGCLIAIALTSVAIIGTYSRGAMLAFGAMIAVFALRSRAGIVMLIIGGCAVTWAPKIMPAAWLNRMASIQDYGSDRSFDGRLAAWKTSTNIASERITGGGFSSVELGWVTRAFHSPGSLEGGKAAHSIFFQVLGDHGYIGLVIYLVMLIAALGNTIAVSAMTRGRADLAWANQLGRMLQVSIIGFIVGGAALSMAYYDGFVVLLMLTGALVVIASKPVERPIAEVDEPSWKREDAGGARAHPALPGAGVM